MHAWAAAEMPRWRFSGRFGRESKGACEHVHVQHPKLTNKAPPADWLLYAWFSIKRMLVDMLVVMEFATWSARGCPGEGAWARPPRVAAAGVHVAA